MATTVQDILDRAYNLSGKTQPGQLVDETTEIPLAVDRFYRAAFLIGAKVNPTFYGAQDDVVGVAGVWAMPATANLIFYIEDGNANPVSIRRLEERNEVWEDPSVYALGRSLYTCGGASDPAGTDTLSLFNSAKPGTSLTALTDGLDSNWDEDHNDLLIYALGIYMATKDMGSQQLELQQFNQEFTAAIARYLEHLRLELTGVVSRFGSVVEASTMTIEDAARLVLGGAAGAS